MAKGKVNKKSNTSKKTASTEKSKNTQLSNGKLNTNKPNKSAKEKFVGFIKNARVYAITFISLILIISIGLIFRTIAYNRYINSRKIKLLATQSVSIDRPVSVDEALLGKVDENNPLLEDSFKFDYAGTSSVGYYGVVEGTTEPVKPIADMRNGGLATGYPTYGSSLNSVLGNTQEQKDKRTALIHEASYLTATGTWNGGAGDYTWMDENGYLFKGTTSNPEPSLDSSNNHRQLYQHTASVGLYGGNVADSEPRLIKTVTMKPRGYNGYGITGLYAPAGEVIKIEISETDMNATGGIVIHIGQALYNGKANNIWTEKNQMQRFPILLNTMQVTKNTSVYNEATHTYTAYVGSFIGGPIYIRNEDVTFSATISGGVGYSHFILGYTTEEEFNENAKSSAPYFDLEVWNYGVLHSGPRRQASRYSYQDIYKAAILWEKVSSVSTTNSNQGIVFLYDPFVAAGGAVAFPGQSSVNCPEGWMSSSLNYNGLVSSGAWGNFHEYHHNFQGFGVGNGGEVTNNAMTLVSYALFTKISSNRELGNYGAKGLSDWNLYTSATWALQEVLKIPKGISPSNGNQGLALYATLLHNFGPDAFIKAKVRQQQQHYGEYYTGYLKAWQDVTHNDMTYYFTDILKGITEERANSLKNSNYSTFLPVSCVYQTGRSYMYDGQKKYFATMQPYKIEYGLPYDIDLTRYTLTNNQYTSGSIILPDNFSYRVKSVTQPAHGSISIIDNYHVKYTPDKNNMRSGQIIVTLEITENNKAFTVDDVDLVLEFEQTTDKSLLTLTTYTYQEGQCPARAEEAFTSGYSGATAKTEDKTTQRYGNTDVWYTYQKPAPDNAAVEVSGKLYIAEDGRYRIALQGRWNCALFLSLDGGNTYKLAGSIHHDKIEYNPVQDHFNTDKTEGSYANTYADVDVKAESWVYFKAVMIGQHIVNANGTNGASSYIGVGIAKWTSPMFTMVDKYYDAESNEVSSNTDPNYHHTITHYYNSLGNEVSEEETHSAELIAPTNNEIAYANAYRDSYEFPKGETFETDYFYKRSYNYSYNNNKNESRNQTIVSSIYSPATNSSWSGYPFNIEKLIDGNRNTWIHTSGGVSENSPLEFVLDLGSEKTVNRMAIYSQSRSDLQVPKAFTLYGSLDGETFFEVYKTTNAPTSAAFYVDFEESTFRYYKMVITKSSNTYIIISEIELWSIFEISNGHQLSPTNNALIYNGDWDIKQTVCNFGHVYAGNENAILTFEFTGTRIGFVMSSALGANNFEVYIDGKKINSINLKEDNGPYSLTYLCNKLNNGKHLVKLKCLSTVYIDSLVIF